MNVALIDNWNEIVGPDDNVFHLGDFSFLPEKQTREILDALNGHINIIRGNHDRGRAFYGDRISIFENKMHLIDMNVNLSHYPETFKDQDGLHLCGHIHTQWRSCEPRPGTIIYNVGVDVWYFKPISMDDIKHDLKNPIHRSDSIGR
jgi:calcineurin-like phosphoesterase family protein